VLHIVLACGAGVGTGVGCGVGSGVGCGVGTGVGCSVGCGVGCGVACSVGVGVGVGCGVGAGMGVVCAGLGVAAVVCVDTAALVLPRVGITCEVSNSLCGDISGTSGSTAGIILISGNCDGSPTGDVAESSITVSTIYSSPVDSIVSSC